MSIFVAASGWLTTNLDFDDGYVVLAIYNLPEGAAVSWEAAISVDGGLYSVASCSTDSVLVLQAPKNQPATVTASATVNGQAVQSATFEVTTNQQVCA